MNDAVEGRAALLLLVEEEEEDDDDDEGDEEEEESVLGMEEAVEVELEASLCSYR